MQVWDWRIRVVDHYSVSEGKITTNSLDGYADDVTLISFVASGLNHVLMSVNL